MKQKHVVKTNSRPKARDKIVGQKNAKAGEGRNFGVYELKALAAEVAKVKSPLS